MDYKRGLMAFASKAVLRFSKINVGNGRVYITLGSRFPLTLGNETVGAIKELRRA